MTQPVRLTFVNLAKIAASGRSGHDLSPDKEPKIPSQGEKRERELQQLVRRGRKPVALFVDEAHDLHGKTLVGLKRLMEVVADGGGMLSFVPLWTCPAKVESHPL